MAMASISLEGDTLGQKHRSYNNLVKAVAADETYQLSELDHNESDIQNMLRIDVACIRRDVEYLLQVLECHDMLYVSCAVKRSVWLVTEAKYSNIINPEYLDKELFPNMTTKAKNKLLVSIRNNLKDATRVETFFNYYKDNFAFAQHWLRHCSIDFIQDIVVKHADEITSNVIKHLCRKSSKILKLYLNSHCRDSNFLHRYILQADREEAIDILSLIYSANDREPNFRKRFTRSLMKRYPDIIIDDFQKYYHGIHMPTFVKYLEKENLHNILFKHIDNDFMKQFFRYDNLKYFFRYMPERKRLELMETLLSKTENKSTFTSAFNLADLRIALGFRCYEYISFDCAFLELKNVIVKESSSYKRNSILVVLVNSAKGNPQHLQTLLEYYRTHLIKESIESKLQFLNQIVTPSSIHRYNRHIWSILEDIFNSMDFSESSKDTPKCFEAMIVYKLIHDEHMPETFKNKVNFKSFLDFRFYLNECERRKVLDYVYEACFVKLCKNDVDEQEIRDMVETVTHVLVLLKDWKKCPKDYPSLINKIRQIIKIKVDNNWDIDLSALYHAHKLHKRQLYDELLVSYPRDEMCQYVLKHDAHLLLCHIDVLVEKCSTDSVSLKQTIGKLRVYWPKSTVHHWIDSYLNRLHQSVGQKTIVQSICLLLPQKEAMTILIKKYAPDKTITKRITPVFSLQQNIAKCLHLIRPSLERKEVVLYAKKEYLRYLLPSLDAILRNQSLNDFWSGIVLLLSYKPLYKYAIRLSHSVLKKNVYKAHNTKKFSLLMKLCELLYKEQSIKTALEIWDLFGKLYSDLSPDQRDKVYIDLYSVPEDIKPISIVKLYHILKTYKSNHASSEDLLVSDITANLLDDLEPTFVENVLITKAVELLFNESSKSPYILAKYILHCDSEKKQVERYEKVFHPIMFRCFESWSAHRQIFYSVLYCLLNEINSLITKVKCAVPVQVFTCIRDNLEQHLNIEEELQFVMSWNFYVIFLEKLRDQIELVGKAYFETEPDHEWCRFSLTIVNPVAQVWLQYLRPILLVDGLLHVIASSVCVNVFIQLNLSSLFQLTFVKSLLTENNDPLLYCIAVDILRHVFIDPNNREVNHQIEANMKEELSEIIRSHPSVEVQMYYNHYANKLTKIELY